MRHRDLWGRPRREDFDRPTPHDRYEERYDAGERDYGQADYSRDYGYDPVRRTGYRVADEAADRDDFGLGDYSEDYAYDPVARRGYRRTAEDERAREDDVDRRYDRSERWSRRDEPRTWAHRDSAPAPAEVRHDRHEVEGRRRRRGVPSDRVIWAVVAQRLADERGLDASDIEVEVHNAEVTLNGTVRDRRDKRRAEDLAELRGVEHVQNNLRLRRSRFGF